MDPPRPQPGRLPILSRRGKRRKNIPKQNFCRTEPGEKLANPTKAPPASALTPTETGTLCGEVISSFSTCKSICKQGKGLATTHAAKSTRDRIPSPSPRSGPSPPSSAASTQTTPSRCTSPSTPTASTGSAPGAGPGTFHPTTTSWSVTRVLFS